MPAFSTLKNNSKTDIAAIVGRVAIGNKYIPDLVCTSITRRVGIAPGTATIRYAPADTSWQATLLTPNYGFGARVTVYLQEANNDGTPADREILFQGQILKRQDQGSDNAIIWTCLDDRWWLQQIPIRGCIVQDVFGAGDSKPEQDATDSMKFISRFIARTNPDGKWNCMGARFKGYVYPVFAQRANIGMNYESPDQAYTEQLEVGKLAAWTPRRFLQYLCLLSMMGDSYFPAVEGHEAGEFGVPGQYNSEWRSLKGSERITWDYSSIAGLKGYDPASPEAPNGLPDPLDRKLADMNFQGMTLLGAINRVLEAAGTHNLTLDMEPQREAATEDDPPPPIRSRVAFMPKGYSGLASNGLEMAIDLRRGGSVYSIADEPIYDFSLMEDASVAVESVLVEGAPKQIETDICYDATDPEVSAGNPINCLVPAWRTEEEEAFKVIINGGATSTSTQPFALVPESILGIGSSTSSTYVLADGLEGRPFALARTAEAIALARRIYPRVFRAFYVDGYKLITGLATLVASEDSVDDLERRNTFFPLLNGARQILAEQLQFQVQSLDGGQDQSNWLKNHYPIRIQVKPPSVGTWMDVEYSSGVRTTPDGLIWFDSLSETVDGDYSCIYDKSLKVDPLNAVVNPIRLNLAMPLDQRVMGRASNATYLKYTFSFGDVGGGAAWPMLYIDSPNAYHVKRQVNSRPAANIKFYGGYDGTTELTQPLTRGVPPGGEANSALYAAERRLASARHPVRHTTWKLAGIRPEFEAGFWLGKIHMVDSVNENDKDYIIGAPVNEVTLDFMEQTTIFGGVESSFVGSRG